MARLTWSQIKSEATLELRNRSDIGTRLETWLRDAYMEIAYGFRFYALEKTTTFNLSVNASEVTLPASDIKHTLSIKDTTNKIRLLPASFRWIDRRDTGSGAPTHYSRFGNLYVFDSAPSSSAVSYKLRYRKQIDEPVFSGSALPETPQEWDEVIRMKAVSRGFRSLFEVEMAMFWDQQADRMIARIPTDEFVDAEDSEFGITPRV